MYNFLNENKYLCKSMRYSVLVELDFQQMFGWLKSSTVHLVLSLIWGTVLGKYCPDSLAGPWSVTSFQDDIMCLLLLCPCPKALHHNIRINQKPSCTKRYVPTYTHASPSHLHKHFLSPLHTHTHSHSSEVPHYAWK